MQVRNLGRVPYLPTWRAMREFTDRRLPDTEDELWLVEHDPVYTLGQAGRREHLLGPTGIPVVDCDRGGQVTYHGPGQVVVYTLLDLRRARLFVREAVYRIEQAIVQALAGLGVDGRRVAGAPGVYVPWFRPASAPAAGGEPAAADDRFAGLAKVAALGLKVGHGCTYHGLSLNVAMDLRPYALIDPCGYRGLATTDLATLGVHAAWQDVADALVGRLRAHLDAR